MQNANNKKQSNFNKYKAALEKVRQELKKKGELSEKIRTNNAISKEKLNQLRRLKIAAEKEQKINVNPKNSNKFKNITTTKKNNTGQGKNNNQEYNNNNNQEYNNNNNQEYNNNNNQKYNDNNNQGYKNNNNNNYYTSTSNFSGGSKQYLHKNGKVYINIVGVGERMIRYQKNGKRFVLVRGKKILF